MYRLDRDTETFSSYIYNFILSFFLFQNFFFGTLKIFKSCKLSFSFLRQTSETMASSPASTKQLPITFGSKVTTHTLPGDCTYIPEPPMEGGKAIIWASHILLPFSISGIVHEFLDPFPESSKKPE